jgi:hypothetical protein
MDFKNNAGLFGIFSMTVFDHASGKPVRVLSVTKKNKITNEGRVNLLTLYAKPTYDVDAKRLGHLRVGTNNANASVNDTESTITRVWDSPQFVWGSTGDSRIIVDPTRYIINISAVFPQGAENAFAGVCEAGVMTNDLLTLYARQTHPPVDKGVTMSITYNWQLGLLLQAE